MVQSHWTPCHPLNTMSSYASRLLNTLLPGLASLFFPFSAWFLFTLHGSLLFEFALPIAGGMSHSLPHLNMALITCPAIICLIIYFFPTSCQLQEVGPMCHSLAYNSHSVDIVKWTNVSKSFYMLPSVSPGRPREGEETDCLLSCVCPCCPVQ